MRHARALLAALLLPRLLLAAAALEPESAGLACDEDDVSPECAAVPGRALLQRTVHQLSGEASEDGKMGVMMKDGERGSAVGSLASQPGVLPVELAEACRDDPKFRDSSGYDCASWAGHSCFKCATWRCAAWYWPRELQRIRGACPKTCRSCPPTPVPTPAPTPQPTTRLPPATPATRDPRYPCKELDKAACDSHGGCGWLPYDCTQRATESLCKMFMSNGVCQWAKGTVTVQGKKCKGCCPTGSSWKHYCQAVPWR